MSASREKKKRQSPEGLSRKQQAAQEAAKKEKKYKLTAAVVSIAVVVFIAFSLYIGLYLPRHAPRTKAALEIGEHKITAAEMNFYYMDGVYAFLNQNSSFLSYLLDTSVPLDQQYYDEENGVTWANYFLDEAAKTAATYYAMYDDAVAAGQGLTEEQSASIDADLESMKETLSTNNAYTGFNNYLEQSYGKGCDEATYRHYLEVQTVAEAWSTAYEDSLTYSDEEVESAYQADPNRYTSVTYRSFYMSKSYFEEELGDDATEEEQAAADAAALEAAKAQAEAMAEACKGDEAAFAQWARDNAPEGSQDTYADDDTTLSREISYENASSYGRDWFYDSARQPGDTAVIRSELGFHIVYFRGRRTQAEAEEADAALSACIDALLEQAASYGTAEVDYSAVTLAPMTVADISAEDLLYPDVGFQRFPEVPLYLQQDFGNLRFGSQYLSIAGCGMCSMAMVSTYMTDTVYTPAMIVELFPQYYGEIGVDGTIFLNGPADLGFYASSQLRSWEDILAKLQQGDPIVTLQIHGVFTTGGHFMVLSRGYEDGTVTVRDSNLKNYARLDGYKTDRFTKEEVLSGGILFYTFQPKLVTLPGCIRCGEGSDTARDYLCEKCAAALTRWEAFLGIDN